MLRRKMKPSRPGVAFTRAIPELAPMDLRRHNNFGEHLRWWRRRRGLSQLELAGAAGSSQRHLSFLESGRAAPSQQMVLSLAQALNMSLRQQNALMASAGYTGRWREGKLGHSELEQAERA